MFRVRVPSNYKERVFSKIRPPFVRRSRNGDLLTATPWTKGGHSFCSASAAAQMASCETLLRLVPFLKNFISSGLAHPIEPLSCWRIPPGNGMGFYQPNSKKLRSWAETFSPYARLPSWGERAAWTEKEFVNLPSINGTRNKKKICSLAYS